jgi:hypothetical protein
MQTPHRLQFHLIVWSLFFGIIHSNQPLKEYNKHVASFRGGAEAPPDQGETLSDSNVLDGQGVEKQEDRDPTEDREAASTRRLEFLDRIALISQSLIRKEQNARLLPASSDDNNQTSRDPKAITPQSDLTIPERYIHIVTTAALPWFTGTSINPLLRAAYLHRKTQEYSSKEPWVTLVVPWLELSQDQEILYNRVFSSQQEQEEYIRAWLREDGNLEDVADPDTGLQLLFYPARYHAGLRSIFAMGDIMSYMDPRKMDVCVLEEPEHCNWFRCPGDGWTKRFQYVVGIVHTSKWSAPTCVSELIAS